MRITYSPEPLTHQNYLFTRTTHSLEPSTRQIHLQSRVTYSSEPPTRQRHLFLRVTHQNRLAIKATNSSKHKPPKTSLRRGPSRCVNPNYSGPWSAPHVSHSLRVVKQPLTLTVEWLLRASIASSGLSRIAPQNDSEELNGLTSHTVGFRLSSVFLFFPLAFWVSRWVSLVAKTVPFVWEEQLCFFDSH